jgi:hypothetical protein
VSGDGRSEKRGIDYKSFFHDLRQALWNDAMKKVKKFGRRDVDVEILVTADKR